ncbi:MAG: hypothetical protein M3N98_09145 [Actinomycetota bacterium]|nr:hypothetical protein [Actinomycetota bacterium]
MVNESIGVARLWLDEAPMRTKRILVGQLVTVLRPFGALAQDIIEPARFDGLATVVLASLMNDDEEGIESALAELEATPSLSSDEEPEGLGFFALGGVVELVYAARLATGDERSASHALARADDVLGAADDDLGTDARAELLRWIARCVSAGTAVEGSGVVAARAAAQAERLQSHRP